MLTKANISSGDYKVYNWDHRNRLSKVTFKDSMGATTATVQYNYDVYNWH